MASVRSLMLLATLAGCAWSPEEKEASSPYEVSAVDLTKPPPAAADCIEQRASASKPVLYVDVRPSYGLDTMDVRIGTGRTSGGIALVTASRDANGTRATLRMLRSATPDERDSVMALLKGC